MITNLLSAKLKKEREKHSGSNPFTALNAKIANASDEEKKKIKQISEKVRIFVLNRDYQGALDYTQKMLKNEHNSTNR